MNWSSGYPRSTLRQPENCRKYSSSPNNRYALWNMFQIYFCRFWNNFKIWIEHFIRSRLHYLIQKLHFLCWVQNGFTVYKILIKIWHLMRLSVSRDGQDNGYSEGSLLKNELLTPCGRFNPEKVTHYSQGSLTSVNLCQDLKSIDPIQVLGLTLVFCWNFQSLMHSTEF